MKLEIGSKFGAWRVVREVSEQQVLCICTACGNTIQKIRKSDLKRGKTLMCKSCSQSSTGSTTKDEKTKQVYNTWMAMTQRCYNPTNKDFKNYGARGITVHPVWKDSFEAFYMHMGPKPTPDHTIERINYDGNYEPGNVKWIPRKDQPLNTRSNVNLTVQGETKLISQWAEDSRCSVGKFTIYKRKTRGWSDEDAVLLPSGQKRSNED